jgi:outer membrane protein
MRAMTLLSLCALLYSPEVFAAKKSLRIGWITDGPWPLQAEITSTFEREITDLLGREVEVSFTAKLVADWTSAGIKDGCDRLLSDPNVDLVLAIGLIAANELGRRPSLPKPVVGVWVIDAALQQIPFKEGKSGMKNLMYLTTPDTVRRDLTIFRELVPFERLAVLVTDSFLETVPDLQGRAEDEARELGIPLTVVRVKTSAAEALAAIPKEIDAVYVTPLLQLTQEEMDALAKGLIAKKLPSFSLLGRFEVERGLLATAIAKPDFARRARRVAVAVQQIALGEDAGTLPVLFAREESLVINMATARAIGFYPRWDALTEAELLNKGRSGEGPKLSLESAANEAVEKNLDLMARDEAVGSGQAEVYRAHDPFLPQIEASATGLWIDGDRALASFGSTTERSISAGVTGTQLLFAERAWANLSIQKNLQRSRKDEREAQRLDLILDTATAYLDVLRAKTIERIQIENLSRTKSHLELARIRAAAGAAQKSEVLRWESQRANDRRATIEASARRNAGEIALNRLLHRGLEDPLSLEDATLESSELFAVRKKLAPHLDNPWGFRRYRAFMVDEGLRASPELRQLDAVIAAQRRNLTSAELAFWLPSLALQGKVDRILAEGGAGTDPPALPFPLATPDNTNWSVALVAAFPLFLGTSRYADVDRAEHELARLELERKSAAEKIEQRIRTALHLAGASYPAIRLSWDAATAAQENLAIATAAYSQGAVSILVLLDAQNAALVTEQAAANATYSFLIDHIRVDRAIGWFDFTAPPEEVEAHTQRFQTFLEQPEETQ